MISPALLQKAMERKALKSDSQKKEADGFSAPAFFNSVDYSLNYVETYFQKSPVVLMDSADEMFRESSLGHMHMPMSAWEMLKEDE